MKKRELIQLKNWERKRQKGIWKYIAINGSIFMAVFILYRVGSDYFFDELPSDFLSLNYIFKQLVSTSIGGLVYGLITWYFNETSYKGLLKKQANESNS